MKRTKNTVQKPIEKAWDGDLSDFEKGNGVSQNGRNFQNYYQFSKSMPSMSGILGKAKYETIPNDEVYTDDENIHNYSADEFAAEDVINRARSLKTGRQRKKLAARSKGSEFRANRKKKRVHFRCISSEIDVEKMEDELLVDPECLGNGSTRSTLMCCICTRRMTLPLPVHPPISP
jgi:hypothetical protein